MQKKKTLVPVVDFLFRSFFFSTDSPTNSFPPIDLSIHSMSKWAVSHLQEASILFFFFFRIFVGTSVQALSPCQSFCLLFSPSPSVSFLLFLFPPNSFVRQQIERKHSEAARVYLPPLQRIHHEKSKYILGTRTHTLRTHVSLSVCSTCIFYYTDCPRDSIPIVPTSLRNKISI